MRDRVEAAADAFCTAVAVAILAVFLRGQAFSLLMATECACVVVVCACLPLSHRHPLFAACVASPPVLFASLAEARGGPFSAADQGLSLVIFLLCYRLGSRAGSRGGGTGMVVLFAFWQIGEHDFNPALIFLTVGPWLGGLAIAAHIRVHAEMSLLNTVLRHEQQRLAEESIRFERLRIARDLHDTVGHAMTVVVLQAAAAELATNDPDLTGDALDNIVSAAARARLEIGQVAGALVSDPDPGPEGDASPPQIVRQIGTLIADARASGLTTTLRFDGDPAVVDRSAGGTLAQIVYRCLQESVTNVLRHAPGAGLSVLVRVGESVVVIEVVNGNAADVVLALGSVGGGAGLTGLRERVRDWGGELVAAPVASGGWRVDVRLPLLPISAARMTPAR